MPQIPLIGQIMPVAFPWVPDPPHWMLCDGRQIDILEYNELYKLIGMTYGGDASKGKFALPDLRGRVITGTYSEMPLGAQGGAASVTLTEQQLPSHTHTLQGSTKIIQGFQPVSPTNAYFAGSQILPQIFGLTGSSNVPLAKKTNVQPSGGGKPHTNMQPYLTLNYVIAVHGAVPQPG